MLALDTLPPITLGAVDRIPLEYAAHMLVAGVLASWTILLEKLCQAMGFHGFTSYTCYGPRWRRDAFAMFLAGAVTGFAIARYWHNVAGLPAGYWTLSGLAGVKIGSLFPLLWLFEYKTDGYLNQASGNDGRGAS